jgi:Zn finger protein HypA/HybF involved in hydrogenase expression
MRCTSCNQYFKLVVFDQGSECESCQADALDDIDSEMQVELELLKRPNGKTRVVFYDNAITED